MTKRHLRIILPVAAILFVLVSAMHDNTTTIHMIGDSTMADKKIDGGKQERGWGMVLASYFDDDIIIENHAVNGRSSKSFIDEGRWDSVLCRLRPGDYVFIQFGHNDEKPQPERHTDPGTTFDDNLRRFVSDARSKGAIPVLFNAVVRRNFIPQTPLNDDDEKLRLTTATNNTLSQEEGDTLYDTHGLYLLSPRNVAQEMGVVFIDANHITHQLEQGLGREASKSLHMWYLPGQEPSLPDGRQDNTHYNVRGANTVARLLANAIGEQIPELRNNLCLSYDLSVSCEGRGDYLTIDDAIAAAPDSIPTTIQVIDGQWQQPTIPPTKNIQITLRRTARWNAASK